MSDVWIKSVMVDSVLLLELARFQAYSQFHELSSNKCSLHLSLGRPLFPLPVCLRYSANLVTYLSSFFLFYSIILIIT